MLLAAVITFIKEDSKMEEKEEPPYYYVCWGFNGLSSPPPVGFKQFYRVMMENMKVLIREISEPGHWDRVLLEMWESPEPLRKEVRTLYEAKYQENPAKVMVGEGKEVKSGIKKVEKTKESKKKKIVKLEDEESMRRRFSPSKTRRLLLYHQRKVEEEGRRLSRLQLEKRKNGEFLGFLAGGAKYFSGIFNLPIPVLCFCYSLASIYSSRPVRKSHNNHPTRQTSPGSSVVHCCLKL